MLEKEAGRHQAHVAEAGAAAGTLQPQLEAQIRQVEAAAEAREADFRSRLLQIQGDLLVQMAQAQQASVAREADLLSQLQQMQGEMEVLTGTLAQMAQAQQTSAAREADLRSQLQQMRGEMEALTAATTKLADNAVPAYLGMYPSVGVPPSIDDLLQAAENVLRSWGDLKDVPEQAVQSFSQHLREQATAPVPPGLPLSPVEHAACRLWTSPASLHAPGHSCHGKEFCSVLCEVTRQDRKDQLRDGALLVNRALNSLVVVRMRPDAVAWPTGRRLFRGSGIPRANLAFWSRLLRGPSGKYRVPMPLATSKDEGVAVRFLRRLPAGTGLEPTLFELRFRPDVSPPCMHVNYLEPASTAKGEEEFLFAAYSTFKVLQVDVKAEGLASPDQPHVIVLEVCQDNSLEELDLPRAPWH